MKTFEFIEGTHNYLLMLNGNLHKTYPKRKNSKREAEDKAADVVNQNIKRYGIRNVNYNESFVNQACFDNPMQLAMSALNKAVLNK